MDRTGECAGAGTAWRDPAPRLPPDPREALESLSLLVPPRLSLLAHPAGGARLTAHPYRHHRWSRRGRRPHLARAPIVRPRLSGGRWRSVSHLSALLLLASYAAAEAPSEQPRKPLRTVSDDLGRAVEVGEPPLRIVSLTPGATEMLFAAGAGSQLIATVQYSSEPPAAREVPRIGDVAAIDMERLVALRPQVVIAWPAGGNPAQQAKIAALGIPLYQQQVARLADLPRSLRRLGELAGTQAVAEQAAAALEARLRTLERTYAAATPEGRRPTVLLQVWNRPIYTVGGRHLMSDALALCGARNVFADLPE